MMATIKTVDDVVREKVKAKMKEYDKKIKEEVLKEAKKKNKRVKGVNSIKFLNLKLPTKKVKSLEFGPLNIDESEKEIVLMGQGYNNGGPSPDTTKFRYKDQLSNSWHWELTAGVTFKQSVTEKVPALASTETSVQIDFSGTYGEAKSTLKEWEWEANVTCEPGYRTVVSAVLVQLAGSVPFTCTLDVDGSVECEGKFEVKHWKDVKRKFSIPLNRLLNDSERTYKTTGEIIGASGVNAEVKKTLEELTDDELKEIGNRLVVERMDDGLLGAEFNLHLE